ncbi:hypothetical protein J6590_029789 [Homalodisca vitripennis]|nr:hypothetical protein J6590_029789 [Homalodisca vitripennis]
MPLIQLKATCDDVFVELHTALNNKEYYVQAGGQQQRILKTGKCCSSGSGGMSEWSLLLTARMFTAHQSILVNNPNNDKEKRVGVYVWKSSSDFSNISLQETHSEHVILCESCELKSGLDERTGICQTCLDDLWLWTLFLEVVESPLGCVPGAISQHGDFNLMQAPCTYKHVNNFLSGFVYIGSPLLSLHINSDNRHSLLLGTFNLMQAPCTYKHVNNFLSGFVYIGSPLLSLHIYSDNKHSLLLGTFNLMQAPCTYKLVNNFLSGFVYIGVGIKFNDQHIPDSPYKLFISPAQGDAHKLEVAQFPTTGVQADKPAQFLVRKNGAKGQLDAKIVSPSGAEDDCFIQSIDPDTYSIRFMPRENGIHNIHVKFNSVHIPGSPFRIKVGKEDADPAAVHASGPGLGDIKTGVKTDFIVDTCSAGAGTLAVTIDGPSKVAMDCTEVEEGYKVRYTPLVPGDYYISLKYNSYHIVGSPFKVTCTGEDLHLAEKGAQETSSVVVETVQKVSKNKSQGIVLPLFKSDASKVTSKGMGLKKAYLQKQNMFTVAATDAGNNILYVGIYGPKGPCDEVYVKHMGRNNFTVNYVVRERGEYIVIVRWGDEHIPGSPFKVDV